MKGTKLLNQYKLDLKRNERQREVCIERGESTTKLRNRAKGLRKAIANLEKNENTLNKLKPRTYYIVEIAAGEGSSHKAIMAVNWDCSAVTIFNATYDEGKTREYVVEEIRYLEIVKELEEIRY